ncbi:MAG TPA: uracil-DNA glycosylase family protein [Thermodesulfovibrionales bacterium]|nr:uracil-DNA glycosylase family protein [Thermodesulfovibrionales bacterium]
MGTKKEEYDRLVSSRKSCRVCQGLENPSQVANGLFDSSEIGPWTRWQGNLDSRVMLVAQDWGHVGNFEKQKGTDNNSETNKMLNRLLEIAGIDVSLPLDRTNGGTLFFTNAILCLKNGSDQASVDSEWYRNCGPRFLKPLIEIVEPKVVICIGQRAYDAVMTCYDRKLEPFRDAADKHIPFILRDSLAVFAVYHCGRRIRNTHRNEREQEYDWKQIGDWFKEQNIIG